MKQHIRKKKLRLLLKIWSLIFHLFRLSSLFQFFFRFFSFFQFYFLSFVSSFRQFLTASLFFLSIFSLLFPAHSFILLISLCILPFLLSPSPSSAIEHLRHLHDLDFNWVSCGFDAHHKGSEFLNKSLIISLENTCQSTTFHKDYKTRFRFISLAIV